MSFDQYGIHLGFLYLRYYGMIIMFGVVMATYLARWMLRQMGEDPEIVWDALTWVLIFGVIGARLYHVLTPSRYSGITTADYLQNPLMILTTWEGGLAMPGAIIGGVLGMYIFCKRNKIKMGTLLDAAAPGIALAQAIGRWGNYINQELYGPPTDLPWGIFIAPQNRIREYAAFEHFHPLFLYESIWNLLNMFFLLWVFKRYGDRLKSGDLFLVYLITYPLGRLLLEFIRLDYVPLFGINFNQGFMLLIAIASGLVIFLRHRKGSTA